MELPRDIESRVERLAIISPTARNILTQERIHLLLIPDEIDADAIRQELFLAVVEDLSEMGVYFTCDNRTAYGETWDDFDTLLDVLEWVLPTTLYPKLQQYDTLRKLLTSLLEGVSDDPILVQWFDTVGAFSPPVHDGCVFCRQNMRSNDMFTHYLENMQDLIKAETLIRANPPHNDQWNALKETLLQRTATVFGFLQSTTYCTADDSAALGRRLEMWLLKPLGDIHLQDMLQFIYLTAPDALGGNDQSFYQKTLYEYHVSNRLFIPYYTVREKTPTFIDFMGMMCMDYALSISANDLTRRLSAYKVKYPSLNDAFDSVVNDLVQLRGKG